MPHIQVLIFIIIVLLGGWLVFFLCDKISNSKGLSYTALSAEEVEDDGEPFEEKIPRLIAELHVQFAESAKLEQTIEENLRGLGYGG